MFYNYKKQKKGSKLKKGTIFFTSLILFAIVFALTATPSYASSDSYNYARTGDALPAVMNSADILSNALGEDISSLEREFLSENEITLKYSTQINSSNIVAKVEDNSLTITLSPFDYIANNGERVSWIPYTVNGNKVSYQNGSYTYTIKDISEDDKDYVDINYHSPLTVNSNDINKYINSAYNHAVEVSGKIDEEEAKYNQAQEIYSQEYSKYLAYTAEIEKYNENLKIYNNYLQSYSVWEKNNKKYNNYLADKAEYDKALKDYNAYIKELDNYNSQYQKYREYLANKAVYEREIAEYNQATSSLDKQTAIYQLEILDFITKKVTSLNRTLASAITGNAVTTVLAEKESLVTVCHVESRAVDLASNATTKLRALIASFKQCETDGEKYMFYILSKEDLTAAFTDLLIALDFIYQYPDYTMVRRIMERQGKVEEFEILLAQLYCICNALTDEVIPNYVVKYKGANKTYAKYFDESYSIGVNSTRTPKEILGEDFLEDKNLSTPLENGFPELPQKPVEPTKVDEPKRPTVVAKPIAPEVVQKPGEPPVEVIAPTLPEKVDEPTPPIKYQPTEKEISFKNALLDGTLAQRGLLSGNISINATINTVKYFRNARLVNVRFFDGVSDNPIYMLKDVEMGSAIAFQGIYPTKQKEGYICTLVGWQDQEGNQIDCNTLQTDKSDLDLYPLFDEKPEMYSIYWMVDGITRTSDHPFNSIPQYDEELLGKLKKTSADVRQYRFIGWSLNGTQYLEGTPLAKVDGEQTYVALFEESYIVTFIVDGIGESQAVWSGDLPVIPQDPQREGTPYQLYKFIGWDQEVGEIYKDTTYNAQFDSYNFATDNGSPLKLTTTDENYTISCNSYSSMYDISNILKTTAEGDRDILLDCTDGSITLSNQNVKDFLALNVVYIQFESVIQSTGGYNLTLKLFDKDGNPCTYSEKIHVSLPNFKVTERCHLMAMEGVFKKEVPYTYKENTLIVDVIPFTVYSMDSLYSISVLSSENATISVNKLSAEKGDKITVKVKNVIDGAYITGIYIVDEKGESKDLDAYTFLMPDSDVTVGVLTEYYKYSVTFKANGKVLFTHSYKYGEKLTPPQVPDITADEGFIYKFVGWDKEISIVSANCEYNAVFEKKEVENTEPLPQGRYDTLARLVEPLFYTGIAVVVLLVIFIPIIVVHKKRKKGKTKDKEDKK